MSLPVLSTTSNLKTQWQSLKGRFKEHSDNMPVVGGVKLEEISRKRVKLPIVPFPVLLHSNFPPSPAQVCAIQQAILDATQLESFLKAGIPESTGYDLEYLSAFIDSHMGVISIVRRIPPEILQEIFSWLALIVRCDADSSGIPREWVRPFRYGQICHSWRMCALAVPSLWSYLPDLKPPVRPGLPPQDIYVKELLRRSGQSTIQFCIHVSPSYLVGDILVEVAERWESAKISGVISCFRSLCDIQGRLHNLTSLDITALGWRPDEVLPLNMFETAPKLRVVTISSYATSVIKLPFHQLIYYDHRAVFPRAPLASLARAMLLETLILKTLRQDPIATFPGITLPRLKVLEVWYSQFVHSVLDSLTIPAIQDISLVSQSNVMDPNLLSALALMISRSRNSCPLRRLCIASNVEAMPRGLEGVLSQTPTLTTLETPIPHHLDIQALSSINDTFALVPKLETCHFWIVTVLSKKASHALNGFASQRCENHEGINSKAELHRLKEVRISTDWDHRSTRVLRVPQERLQFKGVRTVRQSDLEGWPTSDTSTVLDALRRRLFAWLRELESGMQTVTGHNPQFTSKQFVSILDEIESTIVLSGKDILVTEIHLALEQLISQRIPHDDRSLFSDKAKAILAKWRPLLVDALKDLHWALDGFYRPNQDIIYIPDEHEIRRSSSGLSMVYGMMKERGCEHIDRSHFKCYRESPPET